MNYLLVFRLEARNELDDAYRSWYKVRGLNFNEY
jgi:hypothetical protein